MGPLAIDANSNIWFAASYLFKLNGQGYDYTGYNGYPGFNNPYKVAIDVNGNAWALNSSAVGKFNNSGTLLSPSGGYTGLGPVDPHLDRPGHVQQCVDWQYSGGGNVVKVSSTGTLSGTFATGGMTNPGPVAIDTSGNAWIADLTSGAIVELSPTGSALSGTTGLHRSHS